MRNKINIFFTTSNFNKNLLLNNFLRKQ